MIYPKFLKDGDIIGVTAPSAGIIEELDIVRLDNAILNIKKQGFAVIETDNVRTDEIGRSSTAEVRAKCFEELTLNNDVNAIICVAGGDFLLEMLPYLNYDLIKANPKWIQGYSDPTSILYIVTTVLDIATIYGDNFKAFGMSDWHQALFNNFEVLKGNLLEQKSFDRYESERVETVTGLESYNLDKNVNYEIITGEKEIDITGRMIGGCLDGLLSLIGTKYDKTKEFIQRYKCDGFIWYFDNYDLSCELIVRAMWQLREAGWFEYCNGIIFGRSLEETSWYDVSFNDAVKVSLEDLNIPIVTGADIGHLPPRMPIINGAITNLKVKNGKGSIEFDLK